MFGRPRTLLLSSSSSLGLLLFATRVPEQRRADAVVLVIEGAGIGEIFDLAKHLDTDSPMLGEVVFGAPAIFDPSVSRFSPTWAPKIGLNVSRRLPVPSSASDRTRSRQRRRPEW